MEDAVRAAEANGTWASTVQAVRRLSLLNVVLAVSVVFAVSTLGVAIAVPSHGERRQISTFSPNRTAGSSSTGIRTR